MDFSNVAKPPAGAPVATVQRADPAGPSRPVAKTELSPDKAVSQVAPPDAVKLDTSPGAADRAALEAVIARALEKRLEVDASSKAVVFRAEDPKTGEVVDQIPSEQALKLRAYLRESGER